MCIDIDSTSNGLNDNRDIKNVNEIVFVRIF